jgi:hypothetical protein
LRKTNLKKGCFGVALFTGKNAEAKARKAVKKIPHGRVVQLKRDAQRSVGDHINGRTDLVQNSTARWG